jgi:uncharacterized protein YdeI (YjbR/CyaY-like superfamily)
MAIIFFQNQSEFRTWLTINHLTSSELLVGFYKKASGKPSMTWSESVDEAICFGWIDSVRKSVDDNSYCIRFTPRKPTSIWSAVNIAKVERMTKAGVMHDSGLKAFSHRKAEKSEIYSFEKKVKNLAEELESKFKKNLKAWEFFISQAPGYQKTMKHWIMSAKQEVTKNNRLEKLMFESENGRKIT